MTEVAVVVQWCAGCDAALPPPDRDKHAIQVCPVCLSEQPHRGR